MKITTEMCKQAIVEYLKQHPGLVSHEFGEDYNDDFEADAILEKNWKRFEKRKDYFDETVTVRGFDCRPYDDQLRGYVSERNNEIIKVEVVGE